jgi:hypothetical protein
MYGQIATVAFVGIEARPVEVQVRISGGQHVLAIVGLPDKAVAESRERVRNALHAVGLGLPFKHITVNLAPADLPKEGSPLSGQFPLMLAFLDDRLTSCKRNVSTWRAAPVARRHWASWVATGSRILCSARIEVAAGRGGGQTRRDRQ